MLFHSILFAGPPDSVTGEPREAPVFFADLHLDQIIDAVTAGREVYHLQPLFYRPLHDLATIQYRQEIMQDLENPTLQRAMRSFTQKLGAMRDYLAAADRLASSYQQERWFLDAVGLYCAAVTGLSHDLTEGDLHARGLLAFRAYLTSYARSAGFTALQAETHALQAEVAAVRYTLRIDGNCVQVRKYESERDCSAAVAATFARFQEGAARDYEAPLPDWPEMNPVEARILEFVVRLYPDVFGRLHQYCAGNRHYLDETIGRFDREIQFYLAYLEYVATLQRAGLCFCYPRLSQTDKEISVVDGFDVALATKLAAENRPIVCNGFSLQGAERILVVSGPNQGGKTTFARAFGQAHYLAGLGCPVPGRAARLFVGDQLFTHFARDESSESRSGQLQDELLRIHAILCAATPNSIIILNEIFTSTTLEDAGWLSTKIMERLIALDVLGVWVTFLDELAAFSAQTVSLVSTVAPDDPAVRTYKLVRKPADGLAYALSLAAKYRLTAAALKERLP